MSTSSARPDHLSTFATSLTTRSNRVDAEVDAVASSMAHFQETCPDAAMIDRSDLTASSALEQARALAIAVGQVGEAFAWADRGDASSVATANDLALCDVIATAYPGLSGTGLGAPRRDQLADARERGIAIAQLAEEGRWAEIEELLATVPSAWTEDPAYGAALFNELPPEAVRGLVEGMVGRGLGYRNGVGIGLLTLSRLHNAASQTLDESGPHAPRMDTDLRDQLSTTVVGRNALRALVGTSHLPAGRTYLDSLVAPLLLDHEAETDISLTLTAGYLVGSGTRRDGDVLTIDAINRVPGAASTLIHGEIPGHLVEERMARLYEVAEGEAQDSLATSLDIALHLPDLAGPDHASQRARVMNQVVHEVSKDPGAVREPLATALADTTFDDLGYWGVRTQRGTEVDRAEVTAAMEAIASHERSFVTMTTGLEMHQREYLAGAVEEHPTSDPKDLGNIDSVSDALEDGAERADQPGDPWGLAFVIADVGLNLAQQALPGGRVAKRIVRPAVDYGLDRAHEASIPDPGDREEQVDRQQVRRRANAWAAVAEEDRLAGRLRPTVGDVTIRNADDLRRLATDPDAVTDLANWEAGQPDDIVALVDQLAPTG